ncbi:serine/threonine-protein kinase PLK4 [Anabrus simplex]|uniref:serine/threonine-protein kinase PLK4 n=1 Tax=Anabrus simplex TaxID=316456 RepID=UPI0035A3D50C
MPLAHGVSSSFGEQIEDYEVLNLLGKGGFASVYRARCLKTGIEVAIKMIDKKLMQAAGMVERVRQEVAIHSRLKHPSILELYTFFEDVNYVYLVLELCHNGELQRYLKNHAKVLSEEHACYILRQVVQGLLYLHSHNILHRDISLSNLLLTRNMQVKISDFGLATQLTRPDEKHMTMCGTPNYISPEVATRSSHGLEADVWGLGCTLYTILVGHPPFDTDAVKSTLTRVVMAKYELPEHLSPEAKDLIKCLLKKNPKERLPLRKILDHPFMKRCHSQKEFLHQKSLGEDSGMGTISTNTHSQRASFQTVSEGERKSPHPGFFEPLIEERLGPDGLDHDMHFSHYSTSSPHHQRNPIRVRSRSEERIHTSSSNRLRSLQRSVFSDDCNKYSSVLPLKSFPINPASSSYSNPCDREGNNSHSQNISYSNCGPSENKSSCTQCSSEKKAASNISCGSKCNHSCEHSHSSVGRNCSSSLHCTRITEHSASSAHSLQDSSAHQCCQNSSSGKERNIRHLHEGKFKPCTCQLSAEKCHCKHEFSDVPQSGSIHSSDHESHNLERCPKTCSGGDSNVCLKSSKSEMEQVRCDKCDSSESTSVKSGNSSCQKTDTQCSHCKRCDLTTCSHSSCRKLVGISCPCSREKKSGGRDTSGERPDSEFKHTKCYHTSGESNKSNVFEKDRSLKCDRKGSDQVLPKLNEFDIKDSENKKDCSPASSPLSTTRLQPTRHRTKNAILTILESGEVCIEFLKKKGSSRDECVVDVCRISSDGIRIVLYRPNGGRGCPVRDSPPDLPEHGADAIYSFESLPSKHWKKYLYASRFVDLVKAKTPKVTYYSNRAKCLLMENAPNPDFEVSFYDGSKITKTNEEVKLTDVEGHSVILRGSQKPDSLAESYRVMWEHYQQTHEHCIHIETVLSSLCQSTSDRDCFPVIVGRRPTSTPFASLRDKENSVSKQISAPMMQSFVCSDVSSIPPKSRKPHSRGTSPSSSGSTQQSSSSAIHVPGIGLALQLPSGEVQVRYEDGAVLTMNVSDGRVKYVEKGSRPAYYSQTDPVPSRLRTRLSQMPQVVRCLVEAGTSESQNHKLRAYIR